PPAPQPDAGRGIEIANRDDNGTHRQERVAALRPQPLAVALLPRRERTRRPLPIPRGDVVHDDIAADVAKGVCDGHTPRPRRDDNAELDLEVEGMGALRPHDRL